jgi:group I intron endonuclease
MEKKCGIYEIWFSPRPERKYIGSSTNLSHRKACHLHNLRNNKHCNTKLQNHYNKYGEENLVFKILLICSPSELVNMEQYFIDTYRPFFNICPIAQSPKGRKLSDEHRRKIGLSKIGNKNCLGKEWTKERRDEQSQRMKTPKGIALIAINRRRNYRPVINIETGIFYDSLKDAAASAGISLSTLSRKMRRPSGGGTAFRFIDQNQ